MCNSPFRSYPSSAVVILFLQELTARHGIFRGGIFQRSKDEGLFLLCETQDGGVIPHLALPCAARLQLTVGVLTEKILKVDHCHVLAQQLDRLGKDLFPAVNYYGESMIASYTVASRMENILMIPIIGIQNTMATFAGQNMGAQRPDRVSKGLGQGVLVSLGMTLILCLAQIAGIPLIIRAFQLDAGAAAICRLHLFSSAVAIPIFAVYFPANGMCQGVGEGFHATFYALLALGLRVVFAYALHKTSLFGYTAIWWSQAMSWTITLVVCYVHFFRGKWKDKSLIS